MDAIAAWWNKHFLLMNLVSIVLALAAIFIVVFSEGVDKEE
jgi:hypothetical protein